MATAYPTIEPSDVPEPLRASNAYHYVHFHHPALPAGTSELFKLYAVDAVRIEADDGKHLFKYGIHHGTALDACQIVANNASGFLSTTTLAQDKVQSGVDDILLDEQYYYILDHATEGNAIYPVVLTFSAWDFPSEVPERWSVFTSDDANTTVGTATAITMSQTVLARDHRCRVSKFGDSVVNAHLVPRDEWQWFNRNRMFTRNLNPLLGECDKTRDVRNGVLLRADIHAALDNKLFFFVPKRKSPVLHFRVPTESLGPMYHNSILQLPSSSVAAFWYARFAWNLFPLSDLWANVPNEAKIKEQISIVDGLSARPPKRKRRSSGTGTCGSDILPPSSSTRTKGENTSRLMPTENGTNALSSPSNEEAEYQEDLVIQKEQFPSMSQEHCHSSDTVWNQIYWYPGIRGVERAKERYKQEHSAVRTVAEPDKAVWSDPDD